jgi:hypothetical protein
MSKKPGESTYVVIAIVKKELQLNTSHHTLLQILSVSVFGKSQLLCALQPDHPNLVLLAIYSLLSI